MKAVIRIFAFCALAAAACGDPDTNDDRGYTKAPLERPRLLVGGEQPTDMALLREPLTPVIRQVPMPDTTPAPAAPAEQPGTAPAPAAQLPEGVTQEMVAAGEQVFGGAGFCFTCHGATGGGTTAGSATSSGGTASGSASGGTGSTGGSAVIGKSPGGCGARCRTRRDATLPTASRRSRDGRFSTTSAAA